MRPSVLTLSPPPHVKLRAYVEEGNLRSSLDSPKDTSVIESDPICFIPQLTYRRQRGTLLNVEPCTSLTGSGPRPRSQPKWFSNAKAVSGYTSITECQARGRRWTSTPSEGSPTIEYWHKQRPQIVFSDRRRGQHTRRETADTASEHIHSTRAEQQNEIRQFPKCQRAWFGDEQYMVPAVSGDGRTRAEDRNTRPKFGDH